MKTLLSISISLLILWLIYIFVKPVFILNAILSDNIYTLNSISYGEKNHQKMDIYLPKIMKSKTPIIFIYGGGWHEGKIEDYKFIGHALSQLGHPVIIPEQSFYPETLFPNFIKDIVETIQYVNINSQKLLNNSLDSFILMGHSSGAYNIALLSTKPAYLNDLYPKLHGIIGLAGPYELPLGNPLVKPIFASATEQDTNIVKNTHAGMPPVLLLHGMKDKDVIPLHTQRWQKTLQKYNNEVEVHLYAEIDHIDLIAGIASPLRWLSPAYQDISNFLNKNNS